MTIMIFRARGKGRQDRHAWAMGFLDNQREEMDNGNGFYIFDDGYEFSEGYPPKTWISWIWDMGLSFKAIDNVEYGVTVFWSSI